MSEAQTSRALNYIKAKGWRYRAAGDDHVTVEICPYCGKDNYHFYVHIGGKKDGVNDCKVCGKYGALKTIMEQVGDRVEGISSTKDRQEFEKEPEPIPDYLAAHERLMDDMDALAYLEDVRGYKIETIKKLKLGLADVEFHQQRGNHKSLVIPFFVDGAYCYAKYRTLPPEEKMFDAPLHRPVPLFHQDAIQPGLSELFFCEGEGDAIALINQGIDNVVGVPGSGLKKTEWVTKLDEANIPKVYVLYDNDKSGTDGAQKIAEKIGIEKCFRIIVPPFKKENGEDGKDINEWFAAGHTLEEFEELKAKARPFEVEGVTNAVDALDELEAEIDGRGSLQPMYLTPWQALTKIFGGCEDGDVVGIIADGKVGKSTFALNWALYDVEQGQNHLFFCLEMPAKRLMRKVVACVSNTDDNPADSKLTKESFATTRNWLRGVPGDLLFGYSKTRDKKEIFNTIRLAVRRYGVKKITIDYLQLMAKDVKHATQEIAQLSADVKALAMELKVVIHLIVQPNRVEKGEVVAARNANGSSMIEKNVDSMIALHRSRVQEMDADQLAKGGFVETEQNFDPNLYARVDLNRYGPGGMTTLWFDGAKSKVTEISNDVKNVAEAQTFGNAPTELVEA